MCAKKSLTEKTAHFQSNDKLNEPLLAKPFLNLAMLKLSECELDAVIMRFWHLFSIEEIAQQLDLTWNDANHLIDNSLAKLREYLTKEIYEKNKNIIEKDNRNSKDQQKRNFSRRISEIGI
jgi:DNA-directed RNA polymerase specialized sigma24 family protein